MRPLSRADFEDHATDALDDKKAVNQLRVCSVARKTVVVGLLLFQVEFVGCKHSDKGFVTGTLLQKDGRPIPGARVIARPTDSGKAAYGTADANGYFELGGEQKGDGIAPGEYQLSVSEDPGVNSDHRKPPTIASKYDNATSSGIGVTVKSGHTEKLELKLDPR